MKKKKHNHADNQVIHFRNRMNERLDIDLTNVDIDNIVFLINTGRAKRTRKKCRNGRKQFLVKFNGYRMKVIYDKKTEKPVTVIPVEKK